MAKLTKAEMAGAKTLRGNRKARKADKPKVMKAANGLVMGPAVQLVDYIQYVQGYSIQEQLVHGAADLKAKEDKTEAIQEEMRRD